MLPGHIVESSEMKALGKETNIGIITCAIPAARRPVTVLTGFQSSSINILPLTKEMSVTLKASHVHCSVTDP